MSGIFGAATMTGCIVFGTGLIIWSRLGLSVFGYALTLAAYALAPLVVTESVMEAIGADRHQVLVLVSTAGSIIIVGWFLQLGFWPRLLCKVPRS